MQDLHGITARRRWLNRCWSSLWLEYRIVSKAFAFALLAILARRMSFITLEKVSTEDDRQKYQLTFILRFRHVRLQKYQHIPVFHTRHAARDPSVAGDESTSPTKWYLCMRL